MPKKKRKTRRKQLSGCSCPTLSQAQNMVSKHKDRPRVPRGAKVTMAKNGMCMVDVVSRKMKGNLKNRPTKRFLKKASC